jgi:protein phosphatase 1D
MHSSESSTVTGGQEAATFTKEHFIEYIENHMGFWSTTDEDILGNIRRGFRQNHLAMWVKQKSLLKTIYGLHTSGTTASAAFIRKGGHLGNTSIVLGYQDECEVLWKGRPLTKDHKPENGDEIARIVQSDGKLVRKTGVPRVSFFQVIISDTLK